jgi:hypothetical protein
MRIPGSVSDPDILRRPDPDPGFAEFWSNPDPDPDQEQGFYGKIIEKDTREFFWNRHVRILTPYKGRSGSRRSLQPYRELFKHEKP